ncbi:conserved Plasmodium protein, unknown function [Plasmodium gallinaceum]|uniref:Rab3-GAP regulatory subunit N-terminal domain-containing protein n=1 Tax=Plasmodium gallinaceum TaxID=5849 RepID=A0A1J1GPI8_PLAGA|nr:conserved Plasmodium protein, unknown function [Plasmodium gallinaceum]CRG94220.1 conserved Plasmodium protein, unknown function [Plasmodium gallinaceum]
MNKNDMNYSILNNYDKQKVIEESNNYLKSISHKNSNASDFKTYVDDTLHENNDENSSDKKIQIEEVFTLEILIKILSKIFLKGNYCITKEDINIKNCKVKIFESKNHLRNVKDEDDNFINIIFYFLNKNYLFFIIYCLNKKNVVYLNFFNPLLYEKEKIEVFNLFFINNFFPHIIFGLNNGKVLLYNHEGIICMHNKFIESKIKNIFIENQKDYILFLHENNIIVNSNTHIIKSAIEKNLKILPFDYIFSINKNICINHIILRCDNSNDFYKKDVYSMYNKDDLICYLNNTIKNIPNNNNTNINYIVTSNSTTLSIFNIVKQNCQNEFLSRKENFSISEKISSKINSFIKNIFTKRSESNDINALNNNSSTIDILNSNIVHCFNDPKRNIIDICICPWNSYLILALDNLGRISLFNISTLNILYIWKSYRSAFMAFVEKISPSNDQKPFYDLNSNYFNKGILFYLKTRNLIEIWDFNTLNKIYSVRTYEDPTFLKIFFVDNNSPNKIFFFNSNHHVFLMNTKFELFYLKWI